MRATINFEVDVSKVEETMAVLAKQQSHTLRLVTSILDNVDGPTLLEEVTESLDLLYDVTSQLQQYRQMLVSFEKARFETMLPQDVSSGEDVSATIHRLAQAAGEARFDNFLERINEEGEDENGEPQEG